jgi:hypothetical protein
MIDLEAIAKRAENVTLTPFKTFPIVFLPNAEGVLLEEYKLINEYLKLGLSARTDIPLLLECVRELLGALTKYKQWDEVFNNEPSLAKEVLKKWFGK